MRTLAVFNHISLDGYFSDEKGDMSWAHQRDPDWNQFTSENASGNAELLFGRVTYEMMASFWPTPQAHAALPVVAERMNSASKVVFSRTLERATWQNTKLLKGDLATEVRTLKERSGANLLLMGSGSIIAQLTEARLIDSYQIVICPIVIGRGRSLFEGVTDKRAMKLDKTRVFNNGNVVHWYTPAS